jgi:hypothetical protein
MHNGFVQQFVDGGLLGLASAVGIVVVLGVRWARLAVAGKSMLGIFPILFLVSFLFSNLSEPHILWPAIDLVWPLFVTVCALYSNRNRTVCDQLGSQVAPVGRYKQNRNSFLRAPFGRAQVGAAIACAIGALLIFAQPGQGAPTPIANRLQKDLLRRGVTISMEERDQLMKLDTVLQGRPELTAGLVRSGDKMTQNILEWIESQRDVVAQLFPAELFRSLRLRWEAGSPQTENVSNAKAIAKRNGP